MSGRTSIPKLIVQLVIHFEVWAIPRKSSLIGLFAKSQTRVRMRPSTSLYVVSDGGVASYHAFKDHVMLFLHLVKSVNKLPDGQVVYLHDRL